MSQAPRDRSHPNRATTPSPGLLVSLGASLLVLMLALASAPLMSGARKEGGLDERRLPKLPPPSEAPVVSLPAFRNAHPRLPVPSDLDVETLRKSGTRYLAEERRRAAGGSGNLGSVVLLARLEPGSADLGRLRDRLLGLSFSGRGAEQTMPLALAYDWLYDQWSAVDREALLRKTLDACDYEIALIRDQRLSPYNVILYNAPFQALMACAIATHRDDPRGTLAMNFAADLWKSRVLPVWRQVMGQRGGWHEGGEYVGIGVGQAIYQVPALWRAATGEDLFATEPGIRGFLEFLVYRTRPDGLQYRWGDGSFFDRIVPDATPLALEFRHSAAYSLRPPLPDAAPSAWPWGPMTDSALVDLDAVARMPLSAWFDGIGMVVARSNWTPDATFVTFKAGDNYWSHVHLDQGAFTIYKGGELAIDSGLYGPSYGSEHHMNYAYQTIAHNTLTVTDPADVVPAPGKDKPRPIANDGGQRRIGSGWGVEAAPLDRAEWEAKRDIYHAATMAPVFDADGLTVAVADVTPAYTNAESGKGAFSDRTRRVEQFWRVFGYDREDDVVVVFDQVAVTRASFHKRWLLHTINRPTISSDRFRATVGPQDRPGRRGGALEGIVLLPKNPQITAIGGHGFEFFVDSTNYDENGTLQDLVAKLGPNRGEPGAWRIELSPPNDQATDQFLVVMLPTLLGQSPAHRVRLLEADGRVGCEIIGPKRTTRWWFTPGLNRAEIEVSASNGVRRHAVEGPASIKPPGRSWLTWLADEVRSWRK